MGKLRREFGGSVSGPVCGVCGCGGALCVCGGHGGSVAEAVGEVGGRRGAACPAGCSGAGPCA